MTNIPQGERGVWKAVHNTRSELDASHKKRKEKMAARRTQPLKSIEKRAERTRFVLHCVPDTPWEKKKKKKKKKWKEKNTNPKKKRPHKRTKKTTRTIKEGGSPRKEGRHPEKADPVRGRPTPGTAKM